MFMKSTTGQLTSFFCSTRIRKLQAHKILWHEHAL
jgi:hypothetical protein